MVIDPAIDDVHSSRCDRPCRGKHRDKYAKPMDLSPAQTRSATISSLRACSLRLQTNSGILATTAQASPAKMSLSTDHAAKLLQHTEPLSCTTPAPLLLVRRGAARRRQSFTCVRQLRSPAPGGKRPDTCHGL